ncbi:hypothetical protein N7474_003511 [Penicillium riverlandense]|uniref:uncharacterized protein n=1 Tax=Penicillium riverlandense TaxID=1903569 RepID=UPI002546AEF1|nr:uncharacterized protein N7474_003511 [Penicillium riverlandense]KAJ5826373.1 hypothetical protein N7474_003511 [Penicillium riverlandense]
MLDGRNLEIVLTAANSAAQAWYGYDQGVVSGILISPDFINVFPQTKVSSIQGITASCFSLGNLVGCLLAACYGNRLGRKNTLRTGSIISAIGAVLQFSSYSFAQLIVGRVINGVGNGCSFLPGGYQWRLPLALQLVPCMCLLSLLPLIPDSPRWLLMTGRTEQGLESIRRYAGERLAVEDPIVQSEYHSIVGALCIERESQISFTQVIARRDRSGHLRRMLLGCGGQFMQQFSGINALNYYFTIILINNVGETELLARILTGCNATSYMVSSAMAFWLIERSGRRMLMLSGLSLQCLAYVMVAISIALLNQAPFQWGVVAVSFLFFFYAVFGFSWGMAPWVYQAEINSLAMRTQGAAAATATNWLCGFICTQFTPTGIQNIGYRFYIIFAVFNIAFIPVVYFLYPETAYRTLEDLDVYFDRDSPHPTIIPINDKVAKQCKRPLEAIEAEANRVAATKAIDLKVGTSEHVEDVDV